ncbi:interferon alpha/beta receptor 1-like [Sardina pilchardus]|uniref:interferon alpha/beta receptor 1-like n=1 Tax=Sardina pilchardus TaxID=27697 RepID=UPI002E0F34D3
MATRTLTRIFLAAVFGLSGVLAVLPPPDNVRIFSEDLGLQLLWDPPVNTSNKLNYTTQYRGAVGLSFTAACVSQWETSCDVTDRITPFGSYVLRVRAELGEQASDWVTSHEFNVLQMSNISAPSMELHTRGGEIEVQVKDPVMRISDFHELYQPVEYVISYGREGEDLRLEERSEQSHVILSANRLTADVKYCVHVHISIPVFNKTSAANHTCIINSAKDPGVYCLWGTLTRIFLAAVFGLSGVLAVLPPPDNVRIFSEDLGLQLLWDPPVNASNKLTYTTQYRGAVGLSFNAVCVSQWETSCDVTDRITPFGSYVLRVRAELGEQASDWVTSHEFNVLQMSNISAPSVELHTRRGEIEVQVKDPVMSLSNFHELYQPVEYVISYGREGEELRLEERSDQSHVILSANRLTADVKYCVHVHISIPMFNKTSATNHTCIINSANDTVAGWQIVLVMLGSFVLVGLATLLLFGVGWYSYRGIRYLHPKAKLPEHFLIPSLLPPLSQMDQAKGQPVELCHPLSIIMDTPQPPLLDGGLHCTSHTQPLLEQQLEREAGGGAGGESEQDGGGGVGDGAMYAGGDEMEPCLPL